MGNKFSKKALTKEKARIVCEDFLWYSKMKERDSFKLVLEYFENYDSNLTNSTNTIVRLNKGGQVFCIAHLDGN